MKKFALGVALALMMATSLVAPSAEAGASFVCSVCDEICTPEECFALCRFVFETGQRGANLCIEQQGPGGSYCTLYGSCIVVNAL